VSEQSLSEKIAALPAEERAARYLQVVREQGISMATQKRWLDEKDEKIASLQSQLAACRARVEAAEKALQRFMDAAVIDPQMDGAKLMGWRRSELDRIWQELRHPTTEGED
jgi:hypothetical protein